MDKRKTNKVGRNGYKNIKTEDIVDLYINQKLTLKEIAKKFNISHWTVLDRLKNVNIRKTTRHFPAHDKFLIPNKENCYWAGFIAADGWIKDNNIVGIELQKSDEDHLKKFCRFLERDEKLGYRSRLKNKVLRDYVTIQISSEQLVSDLQNNFNVVPCKSIILQPPKKLSNDLRKHFIRGYIDGDGCIGWHKRNKSPRVHVVSASEDMMIWIRDTICEAIPGINTVSIYERRPEKQKDRSYFHVKNIAYSLEWGGTPAYKIMKWLYCDAHENTSLNRKYNKYIDYCIRFENKKIKTEAIK